MLCLPLLPLQSDGVYKRRKVHPSEEIGSLKFEELSDVDISHAVPRRLHGLAYTGSKWVAFADPLQQIGWLSDLNNLVCIRRDRKKNIKGFSLSFSYHFKKIIVRYKKIGCNIDVLRQTACLVVNPITVNSFAYLLNCTTVGRAFRLNEGTILNLTYE